MRKVALYGTLAVGFATLANLVHGGSHAGERVPLAAWQWAYVVIVIFCAPVVTAALLWSRLRVAGAWLLFCSMAASLIFGVALHFLIDGPDNVFSQHDNGPGRAGFALTVVLVVLSGVLGSGVGVWAVRRLRWLRGRRTEAPVGERGDVLGRPL